MVMVLPVVSSHILGQARAYMGSNPDISHTHPRVWGGALSLTKLNMML